MSKALRSAINSTFGNTINTRSSGKSKNSKSIKDESKSTRDFLEKEIYNSQHKDEIKEMNQLISYGESDGQSIGTSEEEVENEYGQQQSGQEITTVGEPCYVSQESGQACLAVQEEDALSGDEIYQQHSGQQEESPVQQSTEACYGSQVVQSINPTEDSQQSTVAAPEEAAAGVICTESVQEVEEIKIVEETKITKKTSIVSQETQKVSQSVDQTDEACEMEKDSEIVKEVEPVVKTADVSEQSQSIPEPVVAVCYGAEPVVTPVEDIKKSSVSTKSQKTEDADDAAIKEIDAAEWCGVKEVSEITKKEVTQSLTTKTTEIHQDSSKKVPVAEKCSENIETETKPELKVEMSLEAKSKFSATIEEDSEVLITAKFVNPLSTPLTDGKFWIEADNLGKPYCFEIPHIDAGETVICRALIFPTSAGYEFIVARFISREIKRIIGFTNIRVSRAALSESTNEKIVVPKIVNQEINATKKM
ncbi:uncharacterized protein [Chelonus insularis]|uniref:uncharacterized protein n=1 Tax=Chelonus insularis TaxID=460826 RepID=UPI00158E7862|nr:uncharacterized protein LOC118072484 [Chelonus insularis]